MYSICGNCVKEPALINLIEKYGRKGRKCHICSRKTSKVLNAKDNRLRQLFKALIRYHYSEWEYNTHWGGNGIESLFYGENPILRFSKNTDEVKLEEVILMLIENVYEEHATGVSLFSGYDRDGQQNMLLRAIKEDISPSLMEIAKRLEKENYYNVESKITKLLKPFKGVITRNFSVGTPLFRARIGYKEKKIPISGAGFYPEYHYAPFANDEIGTPPPSSAEEGRLNRPGVSFFYGATTVETAIAEVRPHPGDKISIGKFLPTKDLIIADFTSANIEPYADSDRLLAEFRFINSVNIVLNRVVPPSQRRQYSLTQLIADGIRKLGYDGIIFKSTVGTGYNVTIFYPEMLEYLRDDKKVFAIKSLQYEIESLDIMNGDDYF